MPEPELPTPSAETPRVEDLQFERAQFTAKTCSICKIVIANSYFQIGGAVVCPTCMSLRQIEQAPARLGTFLRAALYGLGGGLAGAVVFAIVLRMGFTIGIISILVGYLVGKAIRRATQGRGGRRYQILALVLTYGCITLSYAPFVLSGIMQGAKKAEQSASSAPSPSKPDLARIPPGSALLALALALAAVAGLCAALPFMMLFQSPASGAINLLIIFFGLQQAWRLTARNEVFVEGPFSIRDGA